MKYEKTERQVSVEENNLVLSPNEQAHLNSLMDAWIEAHRASDAGGVIGMRARVQGDSKVVRLNLINRFGEVVSFELKGGRWWTPMTAKDDQSGIPAKPTPKVGERVVVFGILRGREGPYTRVTEKAGVRTEETFFEDRMEFGTWDPYPDPVPLIREFVSGRRYLVPAGAIIICAYCHKYQGDRAPAAPEYGEELHEKECVVLRARAAYPEAFEQEKR